MKTRGLALAALGLVLVSGCGGEAAGERAGDVAVVQDTARPADLGLWEDAVSAPDLPARPDLPVAVEDTWRAPDLLRPRRDIATADGYIPPAPCEPCGYGAIRGRVCAPNEQVFVSGARVWVDAYACDGTLIRVETSSDYSGYYLLEDVPCGEQRINIRKGNYDHSFTATVNTGQLNDITGSSYKLCFAPTAARIAVITGDWDNIEDLLEDLGLEVDVFELYGDWDGEDWMSGQALALLQDRDRLHEYNILLIDCGEAHYDVSRQFGVDDNIRAFVEGGGSLYMSDFAYIYSERVWPLAIDYYGNNELAGYMGANDGPIVMQSSHLTGYFNDTDMKAYLGNPPSIPIELGLPPLVSVEGWAGTTNMHIYAHIPQFDANQPLVLSFRPTPSSGRVIYTTFHNAEQQMEQMQKVLMYLMFSL